MEYWMKMIELQTLKYEFEDQKEDENKLFTFELFPTSVLHNDMEKAKVKELKLNYMNNNILIVSFTNGRIFI